MYTRNQLKSLIQKRFTDINGYIKSDSIIGIHQADSIEIPRDPMKYPLKSLITYKKKLEILFDMVYKANKIGEKQLFALAAAEYIINWNYFYFNTITANGSARIWFGWNKKTDVDEYIMDVLGLWSDMKLGLDKDSDDFIRENILTDYDSDSIHGIDNAYEEWEKIKNDDIQKAIKISDKKLAKKIVLLTCLIRNILPFIYIASYLSQRLDGSKKLAIKLDKWICGIQDIVDDSRLQREVFIAHVWLEGNPDLYASKFDLIYEYDIENDELQKKLKEMQMRTREYMKQMGIKPSKRCVKNDEQIFKGTRGGRNHFQIPDKKIVRFKETPPPVTGKISPEAIEKIPKSFIKGPRGGYFYVGPNGKHRTYVSWWNQSNAPTFNSKRDIKGYKTMNDEKITWRKGFVPSRAKMEKASNQNTPNQSPAKSPPRSPSPGKRTPPRSPSPGKRTPSQSSSPGSRITSQSSSPGSRMTSQSSSPARKTRSKSPRSRTSKSNSPRNDYNPVIVPDQYSDLFDPSSNYMGVARSVDYSNEDVSIANDADISIANDEDVADWINAMGAETPSPKSKTTLRKSKKTLPKATTSPLGKRVRSRPIFYSPEGGKRKDRDFNSISRETRVKKKFRFD
jgi:hypothetical protein